MEDADARGDEEMLLKMTYSVGRPLSIEKIWKKNKLKNFGVTYLNGLDVELQKNGMYGSKE